MKGALIHEEAISKLPELVGIPTTFTVTHCCRVLPSGNLVTEPLRPTFVKDYDAVAPNPSSWSLHFDVTHWGLLCATINEHRIGAAVVAIRTPDLEMFGGRDDLAVLWDLRVAPAYRRAGVGTQLLTAAERWARKRGYKAMRIETQDINVSACHLYHRQGYTVAAVNPHAYAELPDETQLIWEKTLDERAD